MKLCRTCTLPFLCVWRAFFSLGGVKWPQRRPFSSSLSHQQPTSPHTLSAPCPAAPPPSRPGRMGPASLLTRLLHVCILLHPSAAVVSRSVVGHGKRAPILQTPGLALTKTLKNAPLKRSRGRTGSRTLPTTHPTTTIPLPAADLAPPPEKAGDISTWSYRELQDTCTALGLRASGSARELRERLDALIEGVTVPTAEKHHTERIGALYQRAVRAARRRKFDEARQLYEQVAERNPKEGRVWIRLAQLYSHTRRYRGGELVLRHGLKLNRGNAVLRQALGDYMRITYGKWDEAREHYRQAMALNRSLASVYDAWGRMETSLGNPKLAATLFQAFSLDPISPICQSPFFPYLTLKFSF